MSKDSASTRIRRLDGASRIPLPGSLRTPSTNSSTAQSVSGIATRTTQIFQRASTIGFQQKRPTTLAGLRPPIVSSNALKRSASGDHITNAVTLVTKKTTTVFKKWIGSKSEKNQPPSTLTKIQSLTQTKAKRKPAQVTPPVAPANNKANNYFATPRPLTRSDTFVRTDSPNGVIQFSPSSLTQSTPATCAASLLTTTRLIRPTDCNETTKLLSNNTRHALYTTQSLDSTQLSAAAAQFGDTFEKSANETLALDELKHGEKSTSFDKRYSLNASEAILKPTLATTFKMPDWQAMNVTSSSDIHMTFTSKPAKRFTDDTAIVETNSSLLGGTTKTIDSSDAISPLTNATYSNPDSLDNLQLLEDVSAPSGFLELDLTLQSESGNEHERTCDNILDDSNCSEPDDMNCTLKAVGVAATEKTHMKLPLSMQLNNEKLLDLTAASSMNSSPLNERLHRMHRFEKNRSNTSKLLYMTQTEYSCSERNTPDYQKPIAKLHAHTTAHAPATNLALKSACSDLVLPTRTPDDEPEPLSVPTEVDAHALLEMGSRIGDFFGRRGSKPSGKIVSTATSLQDVNNPNIKREKTRYSFGLDLTESTLDCSIELVDVSLSSNAAVHPIANSSVATHPHSPCTQSLSQQLLPLRRQTSFELDESLGILTPDQMKEFLDSTNTNNTNNLELPFPHNEHKMVMHHMRIDQTPSPEELPLDPVEVKTDVTEILMSQQQQQQQSNIFESTLHIQQAQQMQQQQHAQREQQYQQQQQQLQSSCNSTAEPISTNTDTDMCSSKASDAMTKSNVSKISTSFITSVTSVTSLDTGYQGDGEMSRPASRGACDHSPSNGPATRKGGHVSRQPSFNQQLQQQQMPLVRRQDPMTDSDFFTESDADDLLHRGDRRAQVIDGQLYGPMQATTSVFISEDPEDSCMESSGIFTDVENRCDDDLAQMRRQDTQDAMLDISPEGGEGEGDDSTETVKSNGKNSNGNKSEITIRSGSNAPNAHTQVGLARTASTASAAATLPLGQGQLSSSQTSSTIHSSISTDRLSAATLSNRTSYCSVDGNTVNMDSKSFSSLEEAFTESTTSALKHHTSNGTINNNMNTTVILSPVSDAERARRSLHFITGNEKYTANDGTHEQRASVQRVIPPRKHLSLSSLTTVNGANSGIAYIDGAKYEISYDDETERFSFGASTRGRALLEREARSETGTAGTKVAGGSTASSCSSTTSLSVDNKSNNNAKNINVHYSLEAAVAAAATKATNSNNGTGGLNNSNNKRATPRTTKFAYARNSPKQRAVSSIVSVASVTDIAGSGGGSGVSANCGGPTLNVRKKPTPNKWDAVMNKIQSNKALLPKKNLKEVKSKVSTLRLSNGVNGGATVGGGGCSVTSSPSNSVSSRSHLSVTPARLSASSTPLIRRSPTSTAVSGTMSPRITGVSLPLRQIDNNLPRSGVGSPTTTAQVSKRLFQGVAAKRGRSYSKDSQKSSQSDLSMASAGGGSPKLLAKTPLRAAKKRDVRNLSISPTDLGPPPKTQQTAKGTSTRLKPSSISLTQKRYPTQSVSGTPSATSTAVSTPTGNSGGNLKLKSPPTVKKLVKDQNRGIGNVSTKNSKHTDPPTELHEIHHNNNNTSYTNTTTTNGIAATTTTTRTNSQTPSPILSHHYAKKTTTTTTAAGLAVGGTLLEKKSQSKLLPTRGKALLQKRHQQQRCGEEAPVSSVGSAAVTERLDAIELQRLKYLNRHSCNGRLDYEAIERHLEQTELQEAQRNKSIEVLGVLLQYAVHDLDAFSCPRVKAEKNKIETHLNTTLRLLDDAKASCTRLQDQLCDKEGYYSQREEDLQALHRCEIEKAQASLNQYQTFAQTKFSELETKLEAKDVEHKRTLDSYRRELDNKLAQKQQQFEETEKRELELQERLNALTISEQQLNDKLTSIEQTYTTRLQAAAEREQQLNERMKVLMKELDSLRATKEHRERELRDKLNLSQDEISVLRSSQRSFNESLDRSSSGIGSPRNSSTSELARLQSEADSLHCVLELKQKEISKLTKQNEELMRDAEERAVLQGKISLLESSNEMLKSELAIKSEKEKDFQRQIDDTQKAYNHEMVKRKRLSYDNEALQWQLKQRSEQLHIVETKLHELSTQEAINSTALSSLGGSLNRSQLMNGSSLITIQMDDISPPTSPVVKGVIEKPDSVSWVLEMDDETPEAAASKMVKRAGSFRSVERSPSTRRQLSACSSVINTSLNCVGSGGNYSNGNSTLGPNPLSQSMSATSVIRQHSSDVRHEFNNRAHSRIRSKSVSVKGSSPTPPPTNTPHTGSIGTKSGKKLMRQSSGSASSSARKQHQLELINWKEPISSSSPHVIAIRPRTSTMCSEVAEEQQQQQHTDETLTVASAHDQTFYQRTPTSSNRSKLITCDTSNLNSGERLDMLPGLPTHSSVHDLKKKFLEIQESAGEAMVSGTNSEDEGCSASSDEIVCSVSTSSVTTGSTSSLKNSHMSLEEVFLLEKSLGLNGTPMEVSWSDDQEVFTTGSTV
ncbi:serine-rich adhesin for platelets [Eurosta solidaginis]|uniref:serine-rich adhesin for platelets n=1 Tax=Eurosta solidaginis TaxID=178769 RepID=UPI0035313268